jgi:hypothetical protein
MLTFTESCTGYSLQPAKRSLPRFLFINFLNTSRATASAFAFRLLPLRDLTYADAAPALDLPLKLVDLATKGTSLLPSLLSHLHIRLKTPSRCNSHGQFCYLRYS